MILKFRTNGVWRIIDNISTVDILPFEEGQYFTGATGAVMYQKGNEFLLQAFGDEAYLLNDDGKTIQRLGEIVPLKAEKPTWED